MNPMREVMIDKIVINIGVGESGERQKKALKLLEELTGRKPTSTYAKKTIRNFGIRKGEAIGAKITLRGEEALEFLKKALTVLENRVNRKIVGDGYFSFGIHEHIDIPGVEYDPDMGIFGMDVTVSLKRRGYRVSRRKICKSKVGKSHRVTKDDTLEFLKSLGVEVE